MLIDRSRELLRIKKILRHFHAKHFRLIYQIVLETPVLFLILLLRTKVQKKYYATFLTLFSFVLNYLQSYSNILPSTLKINKTNEYEIRFLNIKQFLLPCFKKILLR